MLAPTIFSSSSMSMIFFSATWKMFEWVHFTILVSLSCEFLLHLYIWFMFCCFDFKNHQRYHQQRYFFAKYGPRPSRCPWWRPLREWQASWKFPQICSWKRVVSGVDNDDVEESIKTNLEMSSNLLSEAAKVNLDSASCLSRLSIDSSLETSPFSSSVRFRTCAFTTGQRSLSILAQHGWSLAMQHIFLSTVLLLALWEAQALF